jgi:hypothetical protein
VKTPSGNTHGEGKTASGNTYGEVKTPTEEDGGDVMGEKKRQSVPDDSAVSSKFRLGLGDTNCPRSVLWNLFLNSRGAATA